MFSPVTDTRIETATITPSPTDPLGRLRRDQPLDARADVDAGPAIVPGDDELGTVKLGGGEDQRVWHLQGRRLRPKLRGSFGDRAVDAVDLVDELLEEPADGRLCVMAEAGAGEQFRVRDDRHDQGVAARELPHAGIGGGVEGVIAVEEAGDRDGIEQRYHSSRSVSTLRRSSPPVAKLPE